MIHLKEIEFLTSACCFLQIAPDPNTAALFTPSHLRDRSREDARQMLDKCRGTVHNERMFDLITDLTALMLQVKVRILFAFLFVVCVVKQCG